MAEPVAELPNGDIVVSFRTISTVIIIDRKTGKIIWKLGAPPLCGQHAPTPLPNGNLLIFDNGPHRLDHPMPFSRVIEVELATKEIVWEYREKRESDFFSPRISNAQRLPNGNTLICEGDFGRMFEVTAGRELVWVYVIRILKDRQIGKIIECSARTDTAQKRSPEQERRQLCERIFPPSFAVQPRRSGLSGRVTTGRRTDR